MKRVIIVLVLIGMAVFAVIRASHKPVREQKTVDPIKQMITELVERHPDPEISNGLLSEWRSAKIAIAPDVVENAVQGTLSFYTPKEARGGFGIIIPSGTEYPVLRLNRRTVLAAMNDALIRVSLMKTIRHEYEHYLQWKAGTAFHDDFPEGSRELCAAIWKRELPVYLDDCRRWEKWWSEYPMLPAMQARCRDFDSVKSFKTTLARQLSQKAPDCALVFDEMAASP